MKVYVVETMECDWETPTITEGVFSTLEKAKNYIKENYTLLEEGNNLRKNRIKHYYGYPIGDIVEDEDGDLCYEYEEDGEVYHEQLGNHYSISIIEWDVKQ